MILQLNHLRTIRTVTLWYTAENLYGNMSVKIWYYVSQTQQLLFIIIIIIIIIIMLNVR
jgi:hypothetical protein